jgi:hypothetical protein
MFMRCVSSNAGFLPPPLFPPEQRQSWVASVLAEIASEPSVKTRNRSNPRGVKRKMSGFNTRKRCAPLNLKCKPVIRIIAT